MAYTETNLTPCSWVYIVSSPTCRVHVESCGPVFGCHMNGHTPVSHVYYCRLQPQSFSGWAQRAFRRTLHVCRTSRRGNTAHVAQRQLSECDGLERCQTRSNYSVYLLCRSR